MLSILTKFTFGIKQKWASMSNTAHNMAGALIGDLDQDGVAEVITYSNDYKKVYIQNGSTGHYVFNIDIPGLGVGPSEGWAPIINAVWLIRIIMD